MQFFFLSSTEINYTHTYIANKNNYDRFFSNVWPINYGFIKYTNRFEHFNSYSFYFIIINNNIFKNTQVRDIKNLF